MRVCTEALRGASQAARRSQSTPPRECGRCACSASPAHAQPTLMQSPSHILLGTADASRQVRQTWGTVSTLQQ